MPRQPKLASGFAALAIGLGLAFCFAPGGSFAAEQATQAPSTHKADEHGTAPHPAAEANAAHPAAAGHDAGGHGGGEPNIIEPQFPLALFTVVVFLGLLGVLGKFAWGPLIAALHHREEHLEHVLLETERARNESEQLLAEHRRRLAAAEDQVRALIEEAKRDALGVADEIQKKAAAEAEASKVRAERDIATARDAALNEIWTKTTDLAVSVAGKVLNKSLNADDHKRLVESAIAELPADPTGRGGNAA